MEKYKFVVIGGGTAGMIAATYIKKYWGDIVDVTVIYDHKTPGIGVGESLTPAFMKYINYVGITREELIKNCNATVKLGLKFKNWLGDSNYFYHLFHGTGFSDDVISNYEAAYDIVNGIFDGDITYSVEMVESCSIPNPNDTTLSTTLHIDATLFSRYVENKFKNQLNIIDGIIVDAEIDLNDNIKNVLLEDGRKIEAEFFIDASGLKSILFNKLPNDWVNRENYLPLDRCIPNPLPWKFDKQPPYTTSEATDQGWILQVPLSNRWGTGYLYSSKFLSDDKAFENFDKFLSKNYAPNSLYNTSRVINFKSGFWKKQWVGNCLAIGLSSGFSEPLEATNIHHAVYQIDSFAKLFDFKIFNHDIKYYNELMSNFYNNVYLYLRFCYCTGRTDSEFWKFITYNEPEEVTEFKEKIKYNNPHMMSRTGDIFSTKNFTKVALGLNIIEKASWEAELKNKNLVERAKKASLDIRARKIEVASQSIDHLKYINYIKSL